MTATQAIPMQRTSGTARCGALTLDIVRDIEGFHALQSFWDALLDQTATRSPFLRWDWVSLWWEQCSEEGARLAIALLRDEEGVPCAIAPLMLARQKERGRRHLTALSFIGGFGDAHGERLDFIVPAGQEADLTPRLCRVFKLLRQECDVLRLNHLPEESPNTVHILAALQESFVHTGVLNRHPCHFIQLPRASADYDARRTGAWRSKIRRRQKAFTTKHAGKASLAGERVSFEVGMKALGALHAHQWPAETSSFIITRSWRFHQLLAAKWLPLGHAMLSLLEADKQIIAAMYGFVDRDEFFQFQMGWNPAFAKLSPGKLVMRWCIDCSIQRGLLVHDMLPSDYEYKRQWCDNLRWLLDIEAYNASSWRAAVFHSLRAARRMLPRRFQDESGPTSHLQEERIS